MILRGFRHSVRLANLKRRVTSGDRTITLARLPLLQLDVGPPLGPESCFFELWSLTFYPEGEEPDPVMEPIVLPYDSPDFPPIPRQDYANIPIQQKGMHAKGFEFMRLSKDVEGLISNYQQIIDGYLAGVPQEKLAKANHLLGGNFDGKIFNLNIR